MSTVVNKPVIHEFISSLGFGPSWRDPETSRVDISLFRWPPDVFAMAATLLRESGAYLQISRPHHYADDHVFQSNGWPSYIHKIATQWRKLEADKVDPPQRVQQLLEEVAQLAGLPLHALSVPMESNLRWMPLVELMAIADQACRGAGTVFGAAEIDNGNINSYPGDSVVTTECMKVLLQRYKERETSPPEEFRPISLCKIVDPTRAIVLPKMRTSQRGATIRSLSLYLALINGTDSEPAWYPTAHVLLKSPGRSRRIHTSATAITDLNEVANHAGPYNFVLYPYPHELSPSQFCAINGTMPSLGNRPVFPHGFFSFQPRRIDAGKFTRDVEILLRRARDLVGPVHGLVLPEMALHVDDYKEVFENRARPFDDLDLIACGVYDPPSDSRPLGRNCAHVRRWRIKDLNSSGQELANEPVLVVQEKHHRWALDSKQVGMYGLASALSAGRTWWEGIELPRRSLNFFAIDAMTACTVLVCEDLARPDPVADVVRAVGPNLVICLLMDGPQLASRWSARYATALADDPGSSVLTLSSLGMVNLSRRREKIHECSRTVALWREPGESPVEIDLPTGSDALLISLTGTRERELTIDGRDDESMAFVLRMAGIYPLRVSD